MSIEKNSPLKRLSDSIFNAMLAFVIVYALPMIIIFLLGVLAVIIQFILTGQINPPGHNGVGDGCYYGDSNCFAPINSNMFWMVLSPSFMRLALFLVIIVFTLSLAGLKFELEYD